jgi:lysophospholipase L1-like esterase
MPFSSLQHPARTASTIAAFFSLALTASAQQTPVPGNFDPQTTQPAARTPRSARAPRSHSPRDDQGHWTPTDFSHANPALPTLIIAGDSTASTGDPDHRGWGAVLADFFDLSKINVINRAVGGRSFRTFYGEGRWKQIVDALKPGDVVIIEFGHNDGGTPAVGNRADLPGIGDDTVDFTKPDGSTETVHSFGGYLRTFIRDVQQKGATPIVATPTVRNIWTASHVERTMGHVNDWDRQVATQEKALFLDHGALIADAYEKLGQPAVTPFFPADHTHTSTDGAILNAKMLIAGLKSLPDVAIVKDLKPDPTAPPVP